MNRLIKIATVTFALCMVAIGIAYAATTIGTPSFGGRFASTGTGAPLSGRSDGLFVDTYAKSKVLWTGTAGRYQGLGQASATYYEDFGYGNGEGLYTRQSDYTITDVAALSVNVARFASGNTLLYWANVQEDTDLDMDATGLDIGGDQTNNDGYTLMGGKEPASGRAMFVGEDPAFKFCVTANFTDIDGSDRFFAGWVANDSLGAVPAAAIGTYRDFAGLGFNTAADNAVIKVQTSAADTETVTSLSVSTPNITLDDSTDMEFCTLVSAAGVVTYTVDGQTDADAPAYSFAVGAALFPMVFYLHDTALADEILLKSWAVTIQ